MSDYTRHPTLEPDDLDPDPVVQLQRWLEQAQAEDFFEPTAMALATATPDGRPSVRMVLYKGLSDGAPVFYTNYESRKGAELALNPYVAAVFWWDRLERQVRIEGRAERFAPGESDDYFHRRPRASQLAAYTSRQSRVVDSRQTLEARLAENAARFEGREVPCPPWWGGYRIRPAAFEFWQGRHGRFHDRIAYRLVDGRWHRERLEP